MKDLERFENAIGPAFGAAFGSVIVFSMFGSVTFAATMGILGFVLGLLIFSY